MIVLGYVCSMKYCFVAHHPFFHVIDFLAALLLLSLAILERPAVDSISVPIVVSRLTGRTCVTLCYVGGLAQGALTNGSDRM